MMFHSYVELPQGTVKNTIHFSSRAPSFPNPKDGPPADLPIEAPRERPCEALVLSSCRYEAIGPTGPKSIAWEDCTVLHEVTPWNIRIHCL